VVRLRLFPREESYFDLFEAAGANLVHSAEVLLEMVEDFVTPEVKAKQLAQCEHEGDRITHEIFVRLNTTFVTPFDREDIYTLASQLDDVVDAIEAAGDMLVLHKVEDLIEPVRAQARLLMRTAEETLTGLRHLRSIDRERLQRYWVTVNELENEGDRLYRRARADLYSFDPSRAEHPARFVLIWKDIIEQLEEGLDGMEHIAHTVESIVLKHA
jgi:predicted phosphate transport protein (TIGR00153 family)